MSVATQSFLPFPHASSLTPHFLSIRPGGLGHLGGAAGGKITARSDLINIGSSRGRLVVFPNRGRASNGGWEETPTRGRSHFIQGLQFMR